MRAEINTPTPSEGNWSLVDASGAVLVDNTTCENAKLIIEPLFYRGQFSTTLARVHMLGAKGKETKQVLRISSSTGKITAEAADNLPKPIVPKFDQSPSNKAKACPKS